MKTCPVCGQIVDDETKFCLNCGTDLQNIPANPVSVNPPVTQEAEAASAMDETKMTEPIESSSIPKRETTENGGTAGNPARQPIFGGNPQINPKGNDMPLKKPFKKILMIGLGVLALLFFIIAVSASGSNSSLKKQNADLQSKNTELTSAKKDLNKQVSDLQSKNTDLQKQIDDLNTAKDSLQSEYDAYKQKMQPYEELDQQKAQQEIENAKAEQTAKDAVQKVWDSSSNGLASGSSRDLYNDALAKVNALPDGDTKNTLSQYLSSADAAFAAQEAAAAAQAEEAAKGYETGITYDQLARTPDDYISKKVKFSGKVIQVLEGTGEIDIRLAVDGNYDNIILGEYDSSIVSSRVLENDTITIYGYSLGTTSYQSVMGGTITIPAVYIEKIDQ
jgi:hypothetical protein